MLVGAVSFEPERDLGELAQRLAAAAALPGEESRTVATAGGLWLYSVGPSDCDNDPVVAPAPDSATFLFGDACRVGRWRARIRPGDLADLDALDVASRWLALRWHGTTRKLSIASDRLGLLWLYFARIPGGVAFSTSFGALAGQLGGRLTVDWDTVLLELAYGYSPDDRTVYEEIAIVPPGAILEIDADRTVRRVREAPQYSDRGARLSTEQKFAALDDIHAAIARRIADNEELVLSLSAGWDSRYALAFLHGAGRLPCCTFGDPGSDEVRGAARVGRIVGARTEVFDIPAGEWSQWVRDVQALGNAGMIQWSGWAESWLQFLRRRGRLPVTGYLGDALSGKHLGRERDPADWVSFWHAWSTDGGWATCDLLTARARDRIASVAGRRLREALSGLSLAFPHQAAMHFDLYGRQRRWVASQANLASRFATPMLFFYDRPLIDFWTSMPVDDLIGQRLYLDYARSRFASLFPPAPKAPTLARRIVGKALRIATGSDRERPSVVASQRFIEPNASPILALLERVRPLLAEHLDVDRLRGQVEKFGREGTIRGSLIARVVNIAILLDTGDAGAPRRARADAGVRLEMPSP